MNLQEKKNQFYDQCFSGKKYLTDPVMHFKEVILHNFSQRIYKF